MDQASASPAASCAHNPAAPRTLPSWQPSEDQARTVGPPPARSSPRSEPHSEPVHIVPRPSSPALCQSDAKGYLLPDFYTGCAPRISGRLTEGLLLWRSHISPASFLTCTCEPTQSLVSEHPRCTQLTPQAEPRLPACQSRGLESHMKEFAA